MKKLVPALFALAGVGFLVPAAKSLLKGEPTGGVFVVIGLAFLTLALVFFAVGRRKSGDGSGTRST